MQYLCSTGRTCAATLQLLQWKKDRRWARRFSYTRSISCGMFGLGGSRFWLSRNGKVIPFAFAFQGSLWSNGNVSCEEICCSRRDAFNAIRKITLWYLGKGFFKIIVLVRKRVPETTALSMLKIFYDDIFNANQSSVIISLARALRGYQIRTKWFMNFSSTPCSLAERVYTRHGRDR